MDLKLINEVAGSEVVFAILFIGGLIIVGRWFMSYINEQKEENDLREKQLIDIYKGQLRESSQRERELMGHLGENTAQLKNIADTLGGVQKNLDKLENRLDDNLQTVWKELGSKVDKTDINNGGGANG